MATGHWDTDGRWDATTWGVEPYWAGQWDWWYQYGTQRRYSLTDVIVEADWTTDSYTPGDGTFRGDLQPGKLTARMYRRDNRFDSWSKMATIWGCYLPTGATWCWYIDTVSARLVSPGDPSGVDLVVEALTWPTRLTTGAYSAARPAETVAARLGYVANRLGTDTGLVLPAWTGNIANDRHLLVAQNDGYHPWLQHVRDAAANGVAYLVPYRGADGSGGITLAYDFWQARTARTLAPSQIISGSVTSDAIDDLVTKVEWAGTDPAGTSTTVDQYGGGYGAYGILQQGPMRIVGQIAAGGLDLAAVQATGTQLLTDRGDPQERYLSSLDLVGPGARRAPNGTLTPWDPATMTWAPNDTFTIPGYSYAAMRVVAAAHRLTLTSWETTLTLTKATIPTALPTGPGVELEQQEAA
jgi:hypothetical protein